MRGAKNTVRRLAAAAMIMGLVLVVLASVAGADDTETGGEVGITAVTNTWDGNGTTTGVCNSFQSDADLNPGAGQQAWLFILNQVNPNTGWSLQATFNPGGTVAGTIIKTENSNIHFQVLSPDNAVLQSAVATNADNGATSGNLVVSHCEHGASVTTSSSSTSSTSTSSTSTSSTSTSTSTSSTSTSTSTSTSAPTTTTTTLVSPTQVTNAPSSVAAAAATQGLPRTGSGTSMPLLIAGIGLILGGGVMVVASRRLTT